MIGSTKNISMMKALGVIAVCMMVLGADARSCTINKRNETDGAEKRVFGAIAAGALSWGSTASTLGTAVATAVGVLGTAASTGITALMIQSYTIAVGATIDNNYERDLAYENCDRDLGTGSTNPVNVDSGKRMQWAMRNGADSNAGVNWHCWWIIGGTNRKWQFHVYIHSPFYKHAYTSENILGFWIARQKEFNAVKGPKFWKVMWDQTTTLYKAIEGMKVERMFSNNPKSALQAVRECRGPICVTGTMGNNYHPVIDIKVYPRRRQHLAAELKADLKEKKILKQWDDFIETEYGDLCTLCDYAKKE